MSINDYISKGERFISPDNELISYSGRIDFTDKCAPVLIYPASYVKVRFTGSSISAVIENKRAYWDNYLGYILDGEQKKLKLQESGTARFTLGKGLGNGEHELMIFKRQDSCHIMTFYGLLIDETAELLTPLEKPTLRLEVYGDSVSAGEVSEAVDYAGCPDPVHNGEYSNSYYSYAWMTARKLDAELHDIAQGGIALLDKTGWYDAPNFVGLESIFDKLQYHSTFGCVNMWDFSLYTPDAVIIAIGQNDNHPVDYMKEDYSSKDSIHWREHYADFIRRLRSIYPNALIVLATTILEHDKSWDRAIDEVCSNLGDERVVHFLYSNNGSGTPGHIRMPEAERMAEELSGFIKERI